MIVNKTNLANMFVNIVTSFNNALTNAKPTWSKVAMKVQSTTSANDYKWMSTFPALREWIGEKVTKQLSAFSYTITNKPYEGTVEISRDDIEDDNFVGLGVQAKGVGNSAAMWPDKLVYKALNEGFSKVCYDGQYFFDTDHPVIDENGVTKSVSNMFDKPLSCSSNAAAAASFGFARTQMTLLTDDNGEPLDIDANVLLVGPVQRDTANTLMTAEELEPGKPNIFRGACEVVVSQRIKGNAWFLLDTTKPILPIIFQERKAPVMVSQVSLDSDRVFETATFRFGAEARGNAGYGFWQLAYGSTGTGVL